MRLRRAPLFTNAIKVWECPKPGDLSGKLYVGRSADANNCCLYYVYNCIRM